jgi:hypothetical protein
MQQDKLEQVLSAVRNSKGLNASIIDAGLPLQSTLLDMQTNHRQEYKAAKEQQKNQSVEG